MIHFWLHYPCNTDFVTPHAADVLSCTVLRADGPLWEGWYLCISVYQPYDTKHTNSSRL